MRPQDKSERPSVAVMHENRYNKAASDLAWRRTPAFFVDAPDISGSRSLRMPRVGFFRGIATPPIKGVVEPHAGFELGEVVRIHA